MKLNYKEYGHGEPVLILHGLLGMLDNWHSFAKKLAEDYWVITIDQRNHGKSTHTDDFNYKLLAEDLHNFMEEMHIPRCHLIGHSMGGKTIMQFLNDYPHNVDKCIVVDIAPKKYKGGHEKIFNSLLDIDIAAVEDRQEVQDKLMTAIDDLPIVLFLMKNLSRNPEGGYRWKANIKSLWDNYQDIIKELEFDTEIDKEVLFIKGSESEYINDEGKTAIDNWFPSANLITIENAGHWVHADKPDLLLQSVRQYLED